MQFVAEGMGGCRIGEVVGGGDSHGLLANECAILRDLATGEEVVECKLEHSKTGYKRYLDIAGVSKGSGIKSADMMRRYWKSAGFRTQETEEAGIKITRPDWWVVRVSLLNVTEASLRRLQGKMMLFPQNGGFDAASAGTQKAQERWLASGSGSQAKKYINVAAGRRSDPALETVVEMCKAEGLEARICPGPLLLASTGGKSCLPTLMPQSMSTAFGPTKEILEKSLEAVVKAKGADPDLEAGDHGRAPTFTTHSLRRLANTAARRHMLETETSAAEIDIYFGWHERVLLKEMQRHYEGMSRRARMRQARITSMI